ncbi:MAG TPA: succinate--CoA ligase, partial [Campylobacterales bacterium]|nr:succinate--CoA ligase [Campylobacterales bacterium]
DRLYELGFEKGLFSELMKTEDYLIPKEYEGLRNS